MIVGRHSVKASLFLIMYGSIHLRRIHGFQSRILLPHRSSASSLASSPPLSSSSAPSTTTTTTTQLLNLSTITKEDLHTIIASWGYPKFRANQVYHWIRDKGVTDVQRMSNLPATLRTQLETYTKPSALSIQAELVSATDGTIKRAYECADGQVIESVLMPYQDGRYTACISSQAGCAQGCVFCATGQMGFSRQLTADEIFEQVARFSSELQTAPDGPKRLSNVVLMGMGEPLMNYRNVATAIHRITKEIGIGARKITISTVGIVPSIRKLTHDKDMPQVRLAVSLHSANDQERSDLLPANRRNGGLAELFDALSEYIEVTGRRITLEWALIAGENDSVATARQLGHLITTQHKLRRDMVHINVIPLNKTGKYGGRPSQRHAVDLFCETLDKEFRITCTPRVRRGIDIDAGCGQLTADVLNERKESAELKDFIPQQPVTIGVYEDSDDEVETAQVLAADDAWDVDDEEFVDVEFKGEELQAADQILAQFKGTTINLQSLDSSTK